MCQGENSVAKDLEYKAQLLFEQKFLSFIYFVCLFVYYLIFSVLPSQKAGGLFIIGGRNDYGSLSF